MKVLDMTVNYDELWKPLIDKNMMKKICKRLLARQQM